MASPGGQRGLLITAAALVVLSLLPARLLALNHWLADLVETLVAPVSHPVSSAARWAMPGDPNAADPAEIRQLRDRLEEARSALLRAQAEHQDLRRLLEEARVLTDLTGVVVTHLSAAVHAGNSDPAAPILRVRAGSDRGVVQGSIATARGEQLVGRVVSIGARSCVVLPITSRAGGPLRGTVILDDSQLSGLACTLEPVGDGTLRGPVEDRRDGATGRPILPEPGALVRLDDPERWPPHARMLVLGRVERVEPSPDQPLRRVLIVRPLHERLDRLRRVGLRIPGNPDAPSQPRSGAAPSEATP